MLVFETEIATPPPPPPLNKQQKKLDLPIEIKLEICGIIKSWQSKSKPILNSSDFERAPEKQNSNAVLTKVSLLNRSWHLAASRYVWSHVILTTDSMPFFVRGVLSSAMYEVKRLNLVEDDMYKQLGLLTADIDIELMELDLELKNSKRTRGMSVESAVDSLPSLSAVTTPGTETPPLATTASPDQLNNEDLLQALMENNTIADQVETHLLDSKFEFDRRLKNEIVLDGTRKKNSPFKPHSFPYGRGKIVQSIYIPSFDPLIDRFKLVFSFLPNCKVIKFKHPSHGPAFIPTLAPNLVKYSRKYFTQLSQVCADDIGVEAWPLLIDGLAKYGRGIKVLNLEACNEKEPYGCARGLATVFPHLKNLECIRLDGLPLGSSDFTWGGDLDVMVMSAFCTNLRAVSLDFCDITLESFYTLWQRCPNLEFLGFAGLHGHASPATLAEPMETRANLKTLRFVDCRVTDELIVSIAKHAPNLDLFRCVYEYPSSFTHWNPNESLTDQVLIAFARCCPKLRTLAISKTTAMTAKGFIPLLKNCDVHLLDFHATDLTSGNVIGVLDDNFMLEIIPFLKSVSVLNLFDQPSLDEKVLIKLLLSCTSLVSLCLNNTKITGAFLKKIIDMPVLSLKRLSLFGCNQVVFDELGWFCESLESVGKSLDTLYLSPPLPSTPSPLSQPTDESDSAVKELPERKGSPLPWTFSFATFEDSWFMDEKLDIFSLFETACSSNSSSSKRPVKSVSRPPLNSAAKSAEPMTSAAAKKISLSKAITELSSRTSTAASSSRLDSSRTKRIGGSSLNSPAPQSRVPTALGGPSRAGSSMSNSSSRTSISRSSVRSSTSSSSMSASKRQTSPKKESDPPGVLTLRKILKKHIFQKEDGDEESQFAAKLKRARLDRLNIIDLEDGIKLLNSASHLYLQHNYISRINQSTFKHLASSLVFLTLAHNKLTSIRGFNGLENLVLLDLEGNLISEDAFKEEEEYEITSAHERFPQSLQYLVLRDNPICQNPEYRLIVVGGAPDIDELDEKAVTNLERRIALRSARPDMDLSQYEDAEEDKEEEKEEDKEEEFAIEDKDDEGVDIIKERIEAILLRSKERQANFRGGKAQQFEKILAESSLERKDHWRQIKNSVY